MRKTNKAQQAQQPQGRVSKQPKGVTELTDQALEQVQGGTWSWGSSTVAHKTG